jgi:hypothetical protein
MGTEANSGQPLGEFEYNLYSVLGMWCMLANSFLDAEAEALLQAALKYENFLNHLDADRAKWTEGERDDLEFLATELATQIHLSEEALRPILKRLPFQSPSPAEWRQFVNGW